MLSWDDFRYVKAIAEGRSLAAAATYLGVNHSTVFRRLGQIEEGLGSRLFERARGGYALTACGEEMVQLAERMGEDIINFERRVIGHDLRPSGELRVTTSDLVLRHILVDLLVRFRRAYPEIALELQVSSQLLNLSRRDADVAVRAVYARPEGLVGDKVANVGWAVFGPRSMAGAAFDVARDAGGHEWVGLVDHASVARMTKWLRDHVGDDRIAFRANTMIGMAEAVAAGMGLGLLPCFIAGTSPGLTRLTGTLPELEGQLWLLTHPDLSATARVRAFLDFCAAEIAERRGAIEGVSQDWPVPGVPRRP
jgi:DNA-binding transcriptional LysR family regulator